MNFDLRKKNLREANSFLQNIGYKKNKREDSNQ